MPGRGRSAGAWLRDEGADVIGIDVSAAMVNEARRRCGGRGRFIVADLAEPLPLDAGSLDGITCSLVLHYLEDWAVPLESFARALRPTGWVVLSLDHPFGSPLPGQSGGYFDTELVADTWEKAGVEVTQFFWRRPLGAVIRQFALSGSSSRTSPRRGRRPRRWHASPTTWRSRPTGQLHCLPPRADRALAALGNTRAAGAAVSSLDPGQRRLAAGLVGHGEVGHGEVAGPGGAPGSNRHAAKAPTTATPAPMRHAVCNPLWKAVNVMCREGCTEWGACLITTSAAAIGLVGLRLGSGRDRQPPERSMIRGA